MRYELCFQPIRLRFSFKYESESFLEGSFMFWSTHLINRMDTLPGRAGGWELIPDTHNSLVYCYNDLQLESF